MNQFFKDRSVVLFQGDSITDCGRNYEDLYSLGKGYPKKTADIYKSLFPDKNITFINRGIAGNRTRDLLGRYQADIRDVHPDFISIMIGINDVWRKYDSQDETTAEKFESNYNAVLKHIRQDLPGTKIMLIEPFVLHTTSDRTGWHEDLDPKIQIVRKLAAEYADYFIPLDGILTKLSIEAYEPMALAMDGVHPTDLGHGIIASEILKALSII